MGNPRVDGFTLITLGRLTFLSPDGSEEASLAKRRLKLALLSVLAIAKRPMSRATLVELFWGDQTESRARHSLSDALSHLRRVLGRSAITTNDQDIALANDAPLVVDAVLFVDAVEARDFALACDLYAGPLLGGVEVEASASFEHWVTRERRRLEDLFFQACQQQCGALARSRRWDACAALATRWLDASPLSADAALFLLNALKAPGTRQAADRALSAYTDLSRRLAREFEAPPDPAVQTLAQSIREGLAAFGPAETPAAPAEAQVPLVNTAAAPNEALAPAELAPPGGTGRPHLWFAAGAALLALGIALAARDRKGVGDAGGARPRIAVAVEVSSPDSSIAWLSDGLPQLITAKLARSPDVEVIPAAQVRALVMRRGPRRQPANDTLELRDLARRLGVTFLASGTMVRDGGALVLDLTVLDAKTGRLVRSDALSRADALTLADEVAAKVLAAANAARPGLSIADLETSSMEAYEQFVRATMLNLQGRNEESVRALDKAIALDSEFVSAVHARLGQAAVQYEPEVVQRLQGVLRRLGPRATEFDRLRSEIYDTFIGGESERSEALARQFVRRYPQDPRAYQTLHDVLTGHGRFPEAEKVWEERLALDSLAIAAGSGPCAPCAAYGALAQLRLVQGKWRGAEQAARRWQAVQPDAPGPWVMLGTVLSYTQRYDEALDAMQRAVFLTADDPRILELQGRLMISARRYDAADSLIRHWSAGESPALRDAARDLRVLLLRELGRFQEANAATAQILPESSAFASAADLMRGSNLAWLGQYAAASTLYERSIHGSAPAQPFPLPSAVARGFCWHHALLADAIAPAGDTVRLRAIADSLETGCAQSYYWRDRVLHHHVRGLVAMRGARWEEAERELRLARWGVAETWTRTNAALARVLLELDREEDAVAVLRDAYASPLNAMGRYQPHSELDYLMALAFRQAGMRDSAIVYERYARRAWRDADVQVKRLLAALTER